MSQDKATTHSTNAPCPARCNISNAMPSGCWPLSVLHGTLAVPVPSKHQAIIQVKSIWNLLLGSFLLPMWMGDWIAAWVHTQTLAALLRQLPGPGRTAKTWCKQFRIGPGSCLKIVAIVFVWALSPIKDSCTFIHIGVSAHTKTMVALFRWPIRAAGTIFWIAVQMDLNTILHAVPCLGLDRTAGTFFLGSYAGPYKDAALLS